MLTASDDPAAFDAGGVSARCVVADPAGGAGDLLMFYEAQSKERQHSIGLATSADGPPSGGSNLKPAAQRSGRSNSRVRAVRPCNRAGGLTWARGAAPVLSPAVDASPDAWDAAAVARPWLVPLGDGAR